MRLSKSIETGEKLTTTNPRATASSLSWICNGRPADGRRRLRLRRLRLRLRLRLLRLRLRTVGRTAATAVAAAAAVTAAAAAAACGNPICAIN